MIATSVTQAPILPLNQDPYQSVDSKLTRPKEIIERLALGAGLGFAFYAILRLGHQLGYIDEQARALLNPIGYVSAGVITMAIIETARLVHDAALAVLGERKNYENVPHANISSRLDRFRKHSWKVISKVENIPGIDALLSRILTIRPAKEIVQLQAPEEGLSKVENLRRYLEIGRQAFYDELGQTVSTTIPREIAVFAVESLGFTIIGGHLLLGIYGIAMFVLGIGLRIPQIIQEIVKKEEEALYKNAADLIVTRITTNPLTN